eukprot:2729412-Pleurochrysis_carterae.AAC.3
MALSCRSAGASSTSNTSSSSSQAKHHPHPHLYPSSVSKLHPENEQNRKPCSTLITNDRVHRRAFSPLFKENAFLDRNRIFV